MSGHRSEPNVWPVFALPGTVVSYSLTRIVSFGLYRAWGRSAHSKPTSDSS